MIEFIKRNKIFSGCLIICLLVIAGLTARLVIGQLRGEVNPDLPLIDDPSEEVDPQISLFSGEFDDEQKTISLIWDYQLNDHSFDKVELYYGDTLISTFTNEMETSVSIFDHGIVTGDNTFELRLYYDEGVVVNAQADIFVDYVFDIDMNVQAVDNNLGKGYLFTIEYQYNTNTPVGIPIIHINSSISSSWDASYICRAVQERQGNYQKIRAYYIVYMTDFPNETVTWDFSYNFKSVGVRVSDTFRENPSEAVFNQENIQVSK